ncbi:MAG: hypothetical protein HZC36_15965 [Armatimonadetes bacterium]|nr:hypothetical protein [Armatimonadota bacterium]
MLSKKKLLGAIAVLMVLQGAFSNFVVMPRYIKDFLPKTSSSGGSALSSELMFLQLFGFREFLAGILWVRGDTYFESGDYDAILPIIRMVTWLDPHYVDVYATGMWHLGYNFTDEESRSDRRYIPYALALGKEGAENNSDTYEMFFETGWMWFNKVDDDYENAVKWFNEANKREDMLNARRNLQAVALQRAGDLKGAIDWYGDLLKKAETLWKETADYAARTNRDTIEGNLDNLLVRLSTRGTLAQERNDGSYDKFPYDTKPPFDVGFSVQAVVEESRVVRVSGTWNVLPVGTRIRFVLRDADFPRAKEAGMEWDYSKEVILDPPKGLTWMQDGLFVKHQQFNRKIDMSRDPTMYPCVSKEYYLEFYYNPRSAAAHIQDKFGWNGEGMTDKNFLREDIRPGTRVVFARLKLTKDQLLRQGEWLDKTPVVATANYIPIKTQNTSTGELIVVPGLRADKPGGVIPRPGPETGGAANKK